MSEFSLAVAITVQGGGDFAPLTLSAPSKPGDQALERSIIDQLFQLSDEELSRLSIAFRYLRNAQSGDSATLDPDTSAGETLKFFESTFTNAAMREAAADAIADLSAAEKQALDLAFAELFEVTGLALDGEFGVWLEDKQ